MRGIQQSLIDLAGSEKATSDKERTKEGRYINTRSHNFLYVSSSSINISQSSNAWNCYRDTCRECCQGQEVCGRLINARRN